MTFILSSQAMWKPASCFPVKGRFFNENIVARYVGRIPTDYPTLSLPCCTNPNPTPSVYISIQALSLAVKQKTARHPERFLDIYSRYRANASYKHHCRSKRIRLSKRQRRSSYRQQCSNHRLSPALFTFVLDSEEEQAHYGHYSEKERKKRNHAYRNA